MLEKMWYLPATGAFSLPELVAVSCRLAVSHRSELKVSDVHSPGFMSGTVTSAELKTRALTSLPGGCAAWTAATEIQDKTSRTLICVFICFSLPESEAFNPNRGKGRGSGVEGRRNSSCHSTLITRHSLAPATSTRVLLLLPLLFDNEPHTSPVTLTLSRARVFLFCWITYRRRNSGPSSVVFAAEPFLPLLQS